MSIHAISFDLVGTLIKKPGPFTEQDHALLLPYLHDCGYDGDAKTFYILWRTRYEQLAVESAKIHKEFSMSQLCELVFAQLRIEANIPLFCEKYLAIWSKKATLISEVRSTLDALSKHFTLLVISNTHYAPLVYTNLREHHLLKYFRHITTSIEHGQRKPSSSIFLDSCKQVELEPHQLLHVGDSYDDDYLGATAAGLQARLLDPTLSYQIPAAHQVQHLAQLVEEMVDMK